MKNTPETKNYTMYSGINAKRIKAIQADFCDFSMGGKLFFNGKTYDFLYFLSKEHANTYFDKWKRMFLSSF